mmetsp:Transcript_17967/g.51807  ORF Transcript_17967/g.51807 Transcript_17967/m.51807 type:complete len:263 (-) Transcript_17967:647-1435(-)
MAGQQGGPRRPQTFAPLLRRASACANVRDGEGCRAPHRHPRRHEGHVQALAATRVEECVVDNRRLRSADVALEDLLPDALDHLALLLEADAAPPLRRPELQEEHGVLQPILIVGREDVGRDATLGVVLVAAEDAAELLLREPYLLQLLSQRRSLRDLRPLGRPIHHSHVHSATVVLGGLLSAVQPAALPADDASRLLDGGIDHQRRRHCGVVRGHDVANHVYVDVLSEEGRLHATATVQQGREEPVITGEGAHQPRWAVALA